MTNGWARRRRCASACCAGARAAPGASAALKLFEHVDEVTRDPFLTLPLAILQRPGARTDEAAG